MRRTDLSEKLRGGHLSERRPPLSYDREPLWESGFHSRDDRI